MPYTLLQSPDALIIIRTGFDGQSEVTAYDSSGAPLAEPEAFGPERSHAQLVVAERRAGASRVVELTDEEAPDYLERVMANGGQLPD